MLLRDGFGLIPLHEVGNQNSLRGFSCGRTELDVFLLEESREFHDKRLGYTSCIFHSDFDGLVGYFTLANDALHLEASENGELGVNTQIQLSVIPSIRIGRFAVRKELQGQGVGYAMMDLLVGETLDSGTLSAARLLVTDALNEQNVIRFYQKCGFQESLWAKKQHLNHGGCKRRSAPATIKMYLDVFAWVDQN